MQNAGDRISIEKNFLPIKTLRSVISGYLRLDDDPGTLEPVS
jgi:hypothetical protein